MEHYDSIVNEISALTETEFQPASDDDLDALRRLGLPESIIDFYSLHEPSSCAEYQVRLWPIRDMLVENSDMVPGAYTSPHGYIVFATTIYGDTYCFDINQMTNGKPRIVLISHEVVENEINAEQARMVAKPIAANLEAFLEAFIRQDVDQECIYPRI